MSPARGPHRKGNRRQQLPDEVASYVRELIMSGEIKPGEFLRMEPIAEAVGVSNTPVREGLLTLRSEGFVHLAPRRGFVVASFTPQDVRDIFWAQAQLAGELAARAAKRITPEQLDELEKLNAVFEETADLDDHEEIPDAGEAFHIAINRAANSHRLALLLESVVSQLPSHFYGAIEGKVTATRSAHPEILEALRKRQERKARTLMEQHMLESADHLIAMLETRGIWGTEQTA